MAGGGGFGPPLMDPESIILPLDDPQLLGFVWIGQKLWKENPEFAVLLLNRSQGKMIIARS
jgi:hypothetical protein